LLQLLGIAGVLSLMHDVERILTLRQRAGGLQHHAVFFQHVLGKAELRRRPREVDAGKGIEALFQPAVTEALIHPRKGRSSLARIQHQEADQGAAHAGMHDHGVAGFQMGLQILQPDGGIAGFLRLDGNAADNL